MSLTKIKRGMIADGAVIVPNNLSATGTKSSQTYLRGDGVWNTINYLDPNTAFTVHQLLIQPYSGYSGARPFVSISSGSVVVSGNISASTGTVSGNVGSFNTLSSPSATIGTLSATTGTISGTLTSNHANITTLTATNATINGQITVGNSSGLIVNGLRNTTSTYGIYYNATTHELTYGPTSVGGGSAYDQSLNTTDHVRFASVTATNFITSGNIKFNDGSTQSTAWTGSVSTATVAGLSTVAWTGQYNDLLNRPTLATVATSGSYSDLTNKPYIPDQEVNATSNVTFNSVAVGSTGTIHIDHIQVAGKWVARFNANTSTIYVQPNAGPNPKVVIGGDLEVAGNVVPQQANQNLGSPTIPWKHLYVSPGTIYFINTETDTTSTLSLSTGTLHVDGVPIVNQDVSTYSSPTFTTATLTTLNIADYTMPPQVATTSGYAMVSSGSGQIEFQPAVLSSNVSIDGGFATSVYTAFDFAVDGGGAYA